MVRTDLIYLIPKQELSLCHYPSIGPQNGFKVTKGFVPKKLVTFIPISLYLTAHQLSERARLTRSLYLQHPTGIKHRVWLLTYWYTYNRNCISLIFFSNKLTVNPEPYYSISSSCFLAHFHFNFINVGRKPICCYFRQERFVFDTNDTTRLRPVICL